MSRIKSLTTRTNNLIQSYNSLARQAPEPMLPYIERQIHQLLAIQRRLTARQHALAQPVRPGQYLTPPTRLPIPQSALVVFGD